MAGTTSTRTPRTPTEDAAQPKRGLAARVSLGKVFAPVPNEFLLIASTALMLTVFGLVMVLSATSATATAAGAPPYEDMVKQGVFALIGVPIMFIASRFPISFWKKIAWPALIGATIFQLLVFVPGLGVEAHGNRNWVQIAGFQFQPAEFLKLTLALWLGYVLFRKHTLLGVVEARRDPRRPGLDPRHLDGSRRRRPRHRDGARAHRARRPLLRGRQAADLRDPRDRRGRRGRRLRRPSPNRMARIMSLFNDNCLDDYLTSCYQPLHGVWALASGGIFGLGLGNSREKYDWLPAAANDYIFAIVGEELGLIGCVVVLGLFALFAIGAFHVIRKTDDPFVRIVSGGITVWIVGQALINVGVVLRVFPVLGVPLPFMSQGGTSLLSVLLACGVLLSFARSLPEKRAVRAPRASSAARARIPG